MAKRPRKRMDDPSNWGGGRRRPAAGGGAGLEPPPEYDVHAAPPPVRRGAPADGAASAIPEGGRATAPAEDTFEGWLELVPRSFAVPSREAEAGAHEPGAHEAAVPTVPRESQSWREQVPDGFALPPADADAAEAVGGPRGSAVDWDGGFDWTAPPTLRAESPPAEGVRPGSWKDFAGQTEPFAGQTEPVAATARQRPYTGEQPPDAPGRWRRVGDPASGGADREGPPDAPGPGGPGGPQGPRGPRRTYRRHGRAAEGPDGRRLVPAGKVLVALIIGLGLAALLNAQGLQSQAEALHVGAARSIAMALVKPIAAISSALRLDKPRVAIEDAMGRGEQETTGVHTRPTDGGSGSSGSGTSGSGSTGSGGSGSSGSASGGTASPSPSPAIFTPTEEDKLALWVGGDSMAMTFGESLVAMADRTGVIETALDYHVSSGLSRPDFFNWPRRLRAEMKAFQPDVVVFASGANDGQDVEHDGKIYYYGTKPWNDLYRERVAAAMNIASGEQGRPVWWVGMPIARDPAQSAIYRNINRIYQQEAKKRPNVHYVDTYTMFSDADGNYSDYLTGLSGKKELMRQGDGIHWSRAGSDLVAAEVLKQIAELYKFKFTP